MSQWSGIVVQVVTDEGERKRKRTRYYRIVDEITALQLDHSSEVCIRSRKATTGRSKCRKNMHVSGGGCAADRGFCSQCTHLKFLNDNDNSCSLGMIVEQHQHFERYAVYPYAAHRLLNVQLSCHTGMQIQIISFMMINESHIKKPVDHRLQKYPAGPQPTPWPALLPRQLGSASQVSIKR